MSSLGVAQQTTYKAVKPLSTHFRPATCREVSCLHYLQGWKTVLADNDLDNINWIRNKSGLNFTEEKQEGTITFIFYAGQNCFRRNTHVISLDRPAIFGVDNGQGFRKQEPDQWVDNFDNHLHKLKGEING